MSSFFVAPIVEGHGETEAVPILLRRILTASRLNASLKINQPLRVKASSFFSDATYRSKYVELAARKAKAHEKGLVLVLLDCEDGCPATDGPVVIEQIGKIRPDVPTLVTLAYREYETWFLTAAPSLRGVCGLPGDLAAPELPEGIRDAKGWLSARMSARYNEPNDQPAMTQQFSLAEARANDSFDRLYRKLETYFAQ